MLNKTKNKFIMNAATRQKLLQLDMVSLVGKAGASVKSIATTMFIIGAVFIAIGIVLSVVLWEGMADWRVIVPLILGVITILLIFPAMSTRKKVMARQAEYLEAFKARHGNVEKVENEVKEFLRNEDNIAFTVTAADSSFHIIGDWFLLDGLYEFVRTSEIVAIVGIMGEGTFLIQDDGRVQSVMFGPDDWGTVFGLFKISNPYILYTTDKVTLQDGSVADVRAAYTKKDFASITKAYMQNKEKQEKIAPFFWVDGEQNYSVCLNVSEFKDEIFQTRASDGAGGSGYDWAALAEVFITEKMPELESELGLDPEADMFCAYSKNAEALQKFATAFREMCNDDKLMKDLFSRAELD